VAATKLTDNVATTPSRMPEEGQRDDPQKVTQVS
jgi:hypothetical protein